MTKLTYFIPCWVLVFSCSSFLSAQDFGPWEPEEAPHEFLWGRLYNSENLNMLVHCGNFQIQSGQAYMAGLNQSSWQEITTMSNFTSINACIDYSDGMLISAVNLTCEDNNSMLTVMSYYSESGVELCTWNFNQTIHRLRWINDTLYAVGWFTEIDGVPANRVARLEGNSWKGLIHVEQSIEGHLSNIVLYNNRLYVGGKYSAENGANTFAYIEDGVLQPSPDNVTGTWTNVSFMEVFNDELYLGGSIPLAQGNVSNHLVKFDGANILPVPGMLKDRNGNLSLMGSLGGMVMHDGYLYIHGDFGYIDDAPISGIARWDGNQWCGFHTEGFNQSVSSIAFFQNFLYAFIPLTMSTDTTTQILWRLSDYHAVSNCTEPLNTLDAKPQAKLTLHPNPAHTHTTLTSAQQPLERLALYDLQGRLLHEAQPGALSYRIPLTGLPAGMYVVQVQVGTEVLRKKVVVE